MPTIRRTLFVTSPMMRGDDVLLVQRQLGASGNGPTQDGLYGENTANAVRIFQRAHQLSVDGIVGNDTWQALFGKGLSATLDPLSVANLTALGALHGFYKDGCRWRLVLGGVEVEGELPAAPATSDRLRVASVMTQFRRELAAALATYRLPVELVVACVCAKSEGRPEALVMEPGCDRNNPENTPTQISVGLTQLHLATARTLLRQPQLKVDELQRPDVAMLAGAAYMYQQTPTTCYDPPLVAAAYDIGALRYNGSATNRWRLLQYPIGTSGFIDSFVRFFNAAVVAVETIDWPDHVPIFARLLRGGTATSTSTKSTPDTRIGGVVGRAEIAQAIRAAADRFSTDADTLGAMAFIESGLRIDAHSQTSTAFGLFQFLDATWADVVRKHGAACGVTVADRRDLRAQCLIGAAFLSDNIRALQNSLGRNPEPVECYAAHFFGVTTAGHLLAGGTDVRADIALGANAQRVIDANRAIFIDGDRTRSVGEVMAIFASKMGTALTKARDLFAGAPATISVVEPQTAQDLGTEPAWLAVADREIGQKEAPGLADNPRIVEYFGATTFGPHPDSVSWCGAFVSFCLREAGVIDKGSARAADWLDFGEPLAQPRVGCVAVLKPQAPGSSGHVGFWVGEQNGQLQMLAGNQHDNVDITAYPVRALFEGGLRWPHRVP
jgi:uncharacterized protein (TIGR02594 family)